MSLYLVDGHALAYRSYYAFANRPLVNSKGEDTSAVYGFLGVLFALIHKYKPPYLAVAFDARKRTFRHDLYEDYKANRSAMPESLSEQLPVIMAVLDAMKIPHFALEGYEADDIIATMVARWQAETNIDIVSGDKDLFQLIGDRVRVIRPGRGGVLEKELDPAALQEAIGLRPDQVVDYLALVGDTSDNVPGVRGIGEKTAKKLLADYDSLDNVYDNLDKITSASVRKKLEAGREDALRSRTLVILRDDVPLDASIEELVRRDYRTDAFRELLTDLEFFRMREQVFEGAPPPAPARSTDPPPPNVPSAPMPAPSPVDSSDVEARYEAIDDPDGLRRLAERLAGLDRFAVDVETSSLDPMRAVLAGISVAVSAGEAYYVPVSSSVAGAELSLFSAPEAPGLSLAIVQEHLAPVLAAQSPKKIGQNIKYDAIVLERSGMPVGGIEFDTMIASYCLDPSRRSHGLDALAEDLCRHRMIPFNSLFATRTRKKDIRTVPLDRVTEYACEDADYTLRLESIFRPMLESSVVRSLFYDVEMPLRAVLQRMETTGVSVDVDFLGDLSAKYTEEVGGLEDTIYQCAGEVFNINSTQKLREILFDKLGLKPTRKTKTGFSTDVDVLAGLAGEHDIIRMLMRYRQIVKLKNTYVDALPRLINPDTHRVHTSYNQTVASTGRLSSSEPNLQNIPIRTSDGREIRRAFVARDPDWVLFDADYSQIELRIMAHLSQDADLVAAFLDDDDIHRRTAAKMLNVAPDAVSDEMRSRAKTVNFGIIYGMGARGLAQSLDIEVDEARQFIDDYFASYPGVKRFIDDTIGRARQDKVSATMLGRVRPLPDIDSSNRGARAFSERIAVNTPVQGTAADIIKLAMLKVDGEFRKRKLRARMILQVHDELLFDVPRDELDTVSDVVRKCMETAIELAVPLKVDSGTGDNWLEAH